MSASLLPLLRVNPVLGRLFLPEEDVQGARTVAMLTHGFWLQQFGGDTDIVGKSIRLDRVPYEIVGVLPADFHVTSPAPKVWVPFSQEGAVESFGRQVIWLDVVARLKPGVTVEQAAAALEVISANNRQRFPETNARRGVFVEPFSEALTWENKSALYMIWLAAGLVLLIACINIANLLLGRLGARSSELAVRAALGAGRMRLARQTLTEALVLAALGGLAGMLLAGFQLGPLVGILSGTIWSDLPTYLGEVSLDRSALGFAVAVTVFTGLLFGILPAIVQSQSNVVTRMSGGGRVKGDRSFLRSFLVVAQTALSMVLLAGVGLAVSAFARAQSNDPGFVVDRLAVLRVELPRNQYAESLRMERGRRIWAIRPSVEAAATSLRERLAAIPGAREVGLSSLMPTDCCRQARIELPDAGDATRGSGYSAYQTVSPTYFEAFGIPLVGGRAFTISDTAHSVIVNEAFMREHFGTASPLGKTVVVEGWKPDLKQAATVVGVVADSLISPWMVDGAAPQFYLPYAGQPLETPGNWREIRLRLSYAIRTQGDPTAVFAAARRAVAETLPDLPIAKLATMESEFSDALGGARTMARLLAGLSLIAVLLTTIGLYGVVAYSVRQRRREFGVRLALGEARQRLLASVLGTAWRLTGYGIALGALGTLLLVRVAENRVFFVADDPVIAFVVMAVALLAVSTFAGYLPAWQASRLDPISVLHHE